MANVTWNPEDKSANITLSNGNLTYTSNATSWKSVRAIEGKSSGKWYWETAIDNSGGHDQIGVALISASVDNYVGQSAAGYSYDAQGAKWHSGSSVAYGSSFTTGDVVGIALDLDNGKIWWAKNGIWQASGNPAAGTNEAFNGLSGEFYPMNSPYETGNIATANFGVSAFSHSVPNGFSGLSSAGTAFTFTDPSPTHQSTVYGNSQTLQLTVTVSGEDPSYTYDATFYYATTSGVIGPTVSGIDSGQPASINWSTVDSGDYSWYLTATSSGSNDTSSTYEFTKKYRFQGHVEINGTRASGIPIRLYKRDTGELIGSDISTTESGIFSIETIYNEYHYAIALYASTISGVDITETNALIYDHLKPGE